MAKKVQPTVVDGKALVAALNLPKGTFVTVDEKEGFLTVGASSDLGKASGVAKLLGKARDIFQKASVKWSIDEQAAVRALYSTNSNPIIEAWCMKCKCNQMLKTYEVVRNARGDLSAKGECPTCGIQVYKFLPKGFKATTPIVDAPAKTKPQAKKENPATGEGKPWETMDIDSLRDYVLKHSFNPNVSKKAQAVVARNTSLMSEKALREYCRSAMIQEASVSALMEKENSKQAIRKANASSKSPKPSSTGSATGGSALWANIKVDSTPEGNFYCSKCSWKGQAKVTRIANGSRDKNSLYAYSICKCGANMNHKISAEK